MSLLMMTAFLLVSGVASSTHQSIKQIADGAADRQYPVIHFEAYRETDFTKTKSVINYDACKLNIGNGFNCATGVFTAPTNGVYHFDVQVHSATGTKGFYQIQKNSASFADVRTVANPSGWPSATFSKSIYLATGETLAVFMWDGTALGRINVFYYTSFSGTLIRAA